MFASNVLWASVNFDCDFGHAAIIDQSYSLSRFGPFQDEPISILDWLGFHIPSGLLRCRPQHFAVLSKQHKGRSRSTEVMARRRVFGIHYAELGLISLRVAEPHERTLAIGSAQGKGEPSVTVVQDKA